MEYLKDTETEESGLKIIAKFISNDNLAIFLSMNWNYMR